jgi:uncharacterized membrane protein YbhN (UPF0104 family)
VHSFFDAISVFFHHLASVQWEYLAIALGLHLLKLVFRAIAWRAILRASYPDEPVPFRSVFGAYVVGVGINSVAPARGGDVVKLYLIKHRIAGSSYATLAPTLLTETLLDFFVAGSVMAWAVVSGVLPTHEVYSRLPSVDWGFFVRHEQATAIFVVSLLLVAAIGLIVFTEHGGETRERLIQGFAILRYPVRFFRGVVLPQAISWVLRIASLYYFLKAFGVDASIHNALLVQVVDSLATLFPATPGGAGTKQGLIVFLFHEETISKNLLLAFSVGMNIALVVFNLVIGLVALFLMARTLSWKKVRAAQAREKAAASEKTA